MKNSLKAVFVGLDPVLLSLECVVLDLLVGGYTCMISRVKPLRKRELPVYNSRNEKWILYLFVAIELE